MRQSCDMDTDVTSDATSGDPSDRQVLDGAMQLPVPAPGEMASPATADLIDVIGVEGAGELCARLGGLSINLPANIVVEVLGEARAEVFHERFGPGRLYVPRSLTDRTARRRRIVELARDTAMTRQEIARHVRVTEKTVYNALRDARERGEIKPAARSPLGAPAATL